MEGLVSSNRIQVSDLETASKVSFGQVRRPSFNQRFELGGNAVLLERLGKACRLPPFDNLELLGCV
jgi:hypothetical protein